MSDEMKPLDAHPPLTIERWSVARLRKHPRNYNEHPMAQIEQLASSLQARGFRKPIVVQKSTGHVITGNGIFAAALHLGLQDVYVAPWDCTDEDALKYLVADNELARMSTADQEMLNGILGDLAKQADSLESLYSQGIGFEWDDIQLRLDLTNQQEDATKQTAGEPETPERPEEPNTVLGMIYALGEHRLICGDSTDTDVHHALMDGRLADLVFTDPPYGVDYKGTGDETSRRIANDDLTGADLRRFLDASFEAIRLRDGGSIYVCHADTERVNFELAFKAAGFKFLSNLIWVKNKASFGWADYRWKHEPILYGHRPGGKRKRVTDRTQTTVWNVPLDPSTEYRHPTQKPIALARRAIMNSSNRGSLVLDPFGGAGATLLAAEQLGRACYMIELDPAFCDVIVDRWETMTGRKAEVISSPEE